MTHDLRWTRGTPLVGDFPPAARAYCPCGWVSGPGVALEDLRMEFVEHLERLTYPEITTIDVVTFMENADMESAQQEAWLLVTMQAGFLDPANQQYLTGDDIERHRKTMDRQVRAVVIAAAKGAL